MKRPLLFLLLVLISVNVFGQKIHFCDSTNVWGTIWSSWNEPFVHNAYSHFSSGKETVKGIEYLVLTRGSLMVNQQVLVREDTLNGLVYYLTEDSTDEVLYNYNWNIGDTVHYSYNSKYHSYFYMVKSIDSVKTNTVFHKVWKLQFLPVTNEGAYQTYFIIEGIGSTIGPAGGLYPSAFETDEKLSCFTNRSNTPIILPSVDYFDNNTSCTLSIQDVSASQPASVHPNPVTPFSRIRLPYEMRSGVVKIINAVGQVIWQRTITNEKEIWIGDKIDVPGVYYYKITDNDGKLLQGKLNKE